MSTKSVISFISKNYVPVALDLHKLRDAKTEDGDFLRSVQKQKEQWQGFWIVSPKGKVLAAHHEYKDVKTWPQEVLATLETGLQKFGKVTPRNVRPRIVHPYRGLGIRPDGRVQLAAYARHIEFENKLADECLIDSIYLSADQFNGFSPPSATKGTSWIIPAKTVREFSRILCPASDLVHMPKPDEVTNARLLGKIIDIRDHTAIMTFQGEIAADHPHPFEKNKFTSGRGKIHGVAEYDLKNRQMRAIAFVYLGIFQGFHPYHESKNPIISAVEWQRTK